MTPREAEVLRYLESYAEENGASPSYDEIAAKLGLVSKGNITRIIGRLTEQGFIRHMPGRARSIEVVHAPWHEGADAGLLAENARLRAELARARETIRELRAWRGEAAHA